MNFFFFVSAPPDVGDMSIEAHEYLLADVADISTPDQGKVLLGKMNLYI